MFIIIWSGLIVWLPPIIEVVSDLSKCSFHIKVKKVNKIFVPSNLLIRFKTLFFILFYLFNFIHIHLKHEQLNILQTHILLVSLWSVFSQFILVLADAFFSTAHDFERQFTTAKQNIFMEENFNMKNSIIVYRSESRIFSQSFDTSSMTLTISLFPWAIWAIKRTEFSTENIPLLIWRDKKNNHISMTTDRKMSKSIALPVRLIPLDKHANIFQL